MKTSSFKRHRAGFVSYLLVLATGAILTALMFAAYRRALGAQVTESKVQLRTDYAEKEEAILRAIVALTPNAAINAMRSGSSVANATTTLGPLSWQNIFESAIAVANSRTSLSPELITKLNAPGVKVANTGDGTLSNLKSIFKEILPTSSTDLIKLKLISSGIGLSLPGNYPPPLSSSDTAVNGLDQTYPIISEAKQYGADAQTYLNSVVLNGNAGVGYGLPVATYSKFNRLKYPAINFGYAKPGESFVAKRNWWAFSMNVSDHDSLTTGIKRPNRNFVLSIYEIPSQLPISAASFMSLGTYASGAAWQNSIIDGGMSVGRANIAGNNLVRNLALRRGVTMAAGSSVDGQNSTDPFAAGVREKFQQEQSGTISLANQTTLGAFYPISLASESGRAAFVPISRGKAFFDRFDTDNGQNDKIETDGARNHYGENKLSSTSWNNYSIGAQQCAMRLDIIGGLVNAPPTTVRFYYLLPNQTRKFEEISFLNKGVLPNLPPGFEQVSVENGTTTLTSTADVAYGAPGGFSFINGVNGVVNFNNTVFGDPLPYAPKYGYVRKSTVNGVADVITRCPFASTGDKVSGRWCISVFPERIPAYLNMLKAAGVGTNNSLAVNVDYSLTGFNTTLRKPAIPSTSSDYGVVLKECKDLTQFTSGFSLVTNLRTFIGDDFNGVPAPVLPANFVRNVSPANPQGLYYPPCSVFTPEKRWGADAVIAGVPLPAVRQNGQVGSLAAVDKVISTDVISQINPLDAKRLGDLVAPPSDITTNLAQIRHPAELPPISMMNWLVLLEEVR